MEAKTPQRRLLDALEKGPVTAGQAKTRLGINEPSKVVKALLKKGYIIQSHRTGNGVTYALFPPSGSTMPELIR